MNILIAGGGNIAHVLIPFLSSKGHRVSLLTRRPELWSREIVSEYHNTRQEVLDVFHGTIAEASSDPAVLAPRADVILFCLPVSQYRPMLHSVAPFIQKGKSVILGAMYGQAGFNWMVHEIMAKFNLPDIRYFSYGLIPWIARVAEYGRRGITFGCKAVNVAAVSEPAMFDDLNSSLLRHICEDWFGTGAVRRSENFLSLTLSVDNQIIHPTRCLGLFQECSGIWETKADVPFFYRDYDDLSAEYLRRLDEDYSAVRDGIKRRFPSMDFRYMLNYIDLEHFSYHSVSRGIKASFTESHTLVNIETPTVRRADGRYELDYGCRFFRDDFTYGVCVAKWFAEQLDLETPMIDELILWLGRIRGETLMDGDGRMNPRAAAFSAPFLAGIPGCYGFSSLEDCLG